MKPGLLAAVIAATAIAATVVAPKPAEAHGLHVRFGGRVHVSTGVAVRVGPPVYYYRPYYYEPYYAYPSYQPYYAPAPAIAAPAPPPSRGFFGLGVLASSQSVFNHGDSSSKLEGEGVGLLGRLHFSPRFELELELAQNRFYDSPRIDSRFGVDGIFLLGEPGGFTPYLLAGVGVNAIDLYGEQDRTGQAPKDMPAQGYVEAGGGIEWEIFQHLALSADLRLQARRLDKNSAASAKLPTGTALADKEDAVEGRVNLIVYF